MGEKVGTEQIPRPSSLHEPTDTRTDAIAGKRFTSEVFPCLMDIGEAMLKCGADVHTIEQMLARLGRAYGAERMNVLAITAVIIVTVTYPDNVEHTFSRRIVSEGGTDFAKLEALSNLCGECCRHPLSVQELRARFDAINARPFPNASLYAGGILACAGFAVFFGGSVLDGLVSVVFALLACLAIKYFKPLTPNTIVFNFATSLVVGIAICLACGLIAQININMVIIGVIMLLIPGVAMTNATRDMLSGDTISGVMRFIESILWAMALAFGFMIALWIGGMLGIRYKAVDEGIVWPFVAMVFVVLVCALGFALFFDVRKRYIAMATLGGLLTWIIFYVFNTYAFGIFVSCLIASVFAAVWAEILARRHKVPSAVFFIIAVIPLVPGRGLYYTMYSAVNIDWSACGSYAISTLMYVAGIAVGICLVAAVVQTWDMWRRAHDSSCLQRDGHI